MRTVLAGASILSPSQTQWAPKLDSHDPSPPLPLETTVTILATPSTYLRYHGASDQYAVTQGGADFPATGTVLVTVFARLLEWPVTWSPIVTQGTESGALQHFGLHWYADEFAKTSGQGRHQTGRSLCLGVTWSVAGGTTAAIIPLNGSGDPGKLGNIYKIQFAMKWNSVDSRTYAACFVDNVSRYQVNTTGQIKHEASASDQLRFGAPSAAGFGASNPLTDEERPVQDIIRLMFESDRTLTITGGEIVAPGGSNDPWVPLVIDASASQADSWVFNLDQGTGDPDGKDGNGGTISVQATGTSWADSSLVDPRITGSGQSWAAAWAFENVRGYSTGEVDGYPQPIFAPVASRPNPTAGELRLRLKPKLWAEEGELRGAEWSDTSGLTGDDTTQKATGVESVKAGTTSNLTAIGDLQGFGGARENGDGLWFRTWFYDKGGTDAETVQWAGGRTLGVSDQMIGVNVSNSSTHYVFRSGDIGVTVTSIARSVGLHEFAYYCKFLGTNMDVRGYIDGVQILEQLNQAMTIGETPRVQSRADTASDEAHWDWMAMTVEDANTPSSEFLGFVATSAVVTLPDLHPDFDVASFDDVLIVDQTAGPDTMSVGTLLYEFAHSGNGGSSFGSFQTLNPANLQDVVVTGDGQDVIRVRVTLTAGMDTMSSPAVLNISLEFTGSPIIISTRNYYSGGIAAAQRLTRGIAWVS